MKLKFNIGYNFQSAIFMGQSTLKDPAESYSSIYSKIAEFNTPYRDSEGHPHKTTDECEKLFRSIKNL